MKKNILLIIMLFAIAPLMAQKKHFTIEDLIPGGKTYRSASVPENKYYIFGKDGCKVMAEKYSLDLLGQIPLVQSVCEGGDEGVPAAVEDGPVYDALKVAAGKLGALI